MPSETLPATPNAAASTDWAPAYESWRHGGWYVVNVHRPSGAVGCVSRNYPDRKWRIVCDDRPGDHIYPSRDAAAHAEHALFGVWAGGACPMPDHTTNRATATLGELAAIAAFDAALGALGEAERALTADLRRLAAENAQLHARITRLRPPLASDPQQECPVECPSCHGDGIIPTGHRDDDFRGRPVPSTPPDTAGFVGDTVDFSGDFSGDPADPADYPF